MGQTFLKLDTGVTGTLPNANFSGGKIGQLKNQVHSTQVEINSDSGNGIATGLSLVITPSATSSKILIIPNLSYRIDADGRGFGIKMFRTVGGSATQIYSTAYAWLGVGSDSGGNATRNRATWHHLDSPNTTSAVTYSINALSESGNQILVQPSNNQSMFTLMEVLA
jgi:hypothetical protein